MAVHLKIQPACLRVVTAVRRVWPESAPLFLRISATDWIDGGGTWHNPSNSRETCRSASA